MAEVVNLSLPALNPNPRYNGLPKRYEDTRPAFVQNFTHQRIVGIGRDIQSRVMNSIQSEKLQALRKAEEAVWEQANRDKAEAIQRVRGEGKAHTEKMLQRKIKEYEQLIKEECLKVEMTMQKIASDQLKEEKERGERALNEAVKRTEDRCHKELLHAVDAARKEEKAIAADAEARMIKKHTKEVEALKKNAADEKKVALDQLKSVKDQERVRAVKEAQEYTQKLADRRLQEVRDEHKTEITKMEDIIDRWQREVRAREAIIAKLEAAKQRVGERLMDVRFHFQDFINRVKLFEAGQSDYLLPPMYLDEIERNGVLSQPL